MKKKIIFFILILKTLFSCKSFMSDNNKMNKEKKAKLLKVNNITLDYEPIRNNDNSCNINSTFREPKMHKILKATTTLFMSGLFDKSFFITAFMAMKYSKWVVISSATLSLIFIGVLSVFLGLTINQYVSEFWVNMFAIGLFFIFGIHMIYDGIFMTEDQHTDVQILGKSNAQDDNNKININNSITDKNINNKENNIDNNINNNYNSLCNHCQSEKQNLLKMDKNEFYHIQNKSLSNPNENMNCSCESRIKLINNSNNTNDELLENANNNNIHLPNLDSTRDKNLDISTSLLCMDSVKSFCKVFCLIFFSEIGDRSQISTIYLTTNFDNFSVILAVIISCIILTIMAVFGGKIIANKVSEKKLTIFAGCVFIVFAVIALYLLDSANKEATYNHAQSHLVLNKSLNHNNNINVNKLKQKIN